ncbi:hypothetical protein QEH52_17920 [Coraliomargarita sp. SDUM461003]|uniref:Uncharacterized protein n=1 Tax=Thalassobacterium maritimum TaxID=3041265 RepID=A0ABU1AZ51_9BACT|nr:hypothetical protein [Coraliomargarita sp. SDUM461003]MDQ8209410.1 hypothetical protein [Coraliomargarita sp. SDUM461003]
MMELPESLQKWSDDELRALNHAIVDHLKQRRAVQARMEMTRFQRGCKVEFWSSEGDLIEGTVIKFNKKTVSVLTEEGTQWNVSPSLLTRTADAIPPAQEQEVIDFDE